MKMNDANKTKAAQTAMQLEPELDPELVQVLADFRSSVHALSEARMSRSRRGRDALPPVLASGSGLGHGRGARGGRVVRWCDCINGIANSRRLPRWPPSSMRQLEEQRMQEEKLLARVDTDVSRQVPKAMEPLAQLMNRKIGSKAKQQARPPSSD